METVRFEDIADHPEHLRHFFANGGVRITDEDGNRIAEVPPAIEPLVEDVEESVVEEDGWLD